MSSRISSLSLKQRVTLVDLETTFKDLQSAFEEELSKQPNEFLADLMLPQSTVRSNESIEIERE